MDLKQQEKNEILISVYSGQRQESLQHRQSIYNSFSLAIAGLLVILGGLLAGGPINTYIRVVSGIGILAFCIYISLFIKQQRNESDKGLAIMLKIEKEWGLYEKDRYIKNETVLPESFAVPGRMAGEYSIADFFHSYILFILAAINILVIFFKG
ncbi:hypothetical protein [Desulforhopalus singaporensis]|uniref:Uncharacterized protein n=1 Tax=Desulforhopalus singaporensis TaxID=91360 RepID=A0A1H0NQR1_9BACT|nr:hypothetical protein [Desulforhopalus singaporensis]SDO94896.1 hypothetical protein SAMN05660330_01402 [Desulforhopalus singaporensis]